MSESHTGLQVMSDRLNIPYNDIQALVINTLRIAKARNENVTQLELVTFLAIANEYKLNPLTKEIYAFSNNGTIQPIVSIDGWLMIINSNPYFDGMEFVDNLDAEGNLHSVTCRIYRKDRTKPTEVTEYMGECKRNSIPWKSWPARMLRHKATIQCARYAFGLSGICDPDEAERIKQGAAHNDMANNAHQLDQPAKEHHRLINEEEKRKLIELAEASNVPIEAVVMAAAGALGGNIESLDDFTVDFIARAEKYISSKAAVVVQEKVRM